jgi:hypothetical protein
MSEQLFHQTRLDIAEYFKNPVLKKVFEVKGVGIYKCVVNSMLIASQQKYIVALVKNDQYPIFTRKRLSDINWFCFQTRQLSKDDDKTELDNLPSCEMPTGKSTSMFLKESVVKIIQDERQVKYVCDTIPVNIICLVTDNKYNTFQESSSLERALMYFNTIVTCTLMN